MDKAGVLGSQMTSQPCRGMKNHPGGTETEKGVNDAESWSWTTQIA
jgi:hypothetical protein